jgi:hypothetical protein
MEVSKMASFKLLKNKAGNNGYASMPAKLPAANSLQANAPANLLARRLAVRCLT